MPTKRIIGIELFMFDLGRFQKELSFFWCLSTFIAAKHIEILLSDAPNDYLLRKQLSINDMYTYINSRKRNFSQHGFNILENSLLPVTLLVYHLLRILTVNTTKTHMHCNNFSHVIFIQQKHMLLDPVTIK